MTFRFLIDYSLFNILVSNVSVFTTLPLTGHYQIEWAKTIYLWIQHIRLFTVFMASLVAAVLLLSMIPLIQSSQLNHLERPSPLVISYFFSTFLSFWNSFSSSNFICEQCTVHKHGHPFDLIVSVWCSQNTSFSVMSGH